MITYSSVRGGWVSPPVSLLLFQQRKLSSLAESFLCLQIDCSRLHLNGGVEWLDSSKSFKGKEQREFKSITCSSLNIFIALHMGQ